MPDLRIVNLFMYDLTDDGWETCGLRRDARAYQSARDIPVYDVLRRELMVRGWLLVHNGLTTPTHMFNLRDVYYHRQGVNNRVFRPVILFNNTAVRLVTSWDRLQGELVTDVCDAPEFWQTVFAGDWLKDL